MGSLFLLTLGCTALAPSDTEYEPKPSPSPHERSSGNQNKQTEKPKLQLRLEFLNRGKGQLYKEQIQPILLKSCTDGSCHKDPEIIALQSYPFDPTGSFTMERIIEELGPNYTVTEAQPVIVDELITAMDTGYMPPGTHEPVSDEGVDAFRQWLQRGLPVANFSGTLKLIGYDRDDVICTFALPIDWQTTELTVELTHCPQLSRITFHYSVSDLSETTIASGQLNLATGGPGDSFVIKIDN